MKIFSVHEPPETWSEVKRGLERFTFVREGFYFWAFLFGPLWMLWRRLFLVLLGYIVLLVGLNAALFAVGASKGGVFAAHLLLAFLVGLEAATLWRWTLRRRGWRDAGVVAADDREAAERRFFDQWQRADDTPAPTPPPPAGLPTMVRPATSSGAIGLFPEPGTAQ
jgi:hypothetical protein